MDDEDYSAEPYPTDFTMDTGDLGGFASFGQPFPSGPTQPGAPGPVAPGPPGPLPGPMAAGPPPPLSPEAYARQSPDTQYRPPPWREDTTHLVRYDPRSVQLHRPTHMAPAQTYQTQNPGGIFAGGRPERLPGGLADAAAPGSGGSSGTLGYSIVAVLGGAALGGWMSGWMGALGGALAGGALVNAGRAVKGSLQGDPVADKEAIASGTFALLSGGAAGYLFWAASKSKPEVKKNPPRSASNRGTPTAEDIVGMAPVGNEDDTEEPADEDDAADDAEPEEDEGEE